MQIIDSQSCRQIAWRQKLMMTMIFDEGDEQVSNF